MCHCAPNLSDPPTPLSEELNGIEQLGVIRRLGQPKEWCHPIKPD